MSQAEAVNCLQLGLIDGMLKGNFEDPYLVTLVPEGQEADPVFNAIQTPPYRLILGEPSGPVRSPAQLLEPLLADVPGDLPGVLGPVDLSKEFAQRYAAENGVGYELKIGRAHV